MVLISIPILVPISVPIRYRFRSSSLQCKFIQTFWYWILSTLYYFCPFLNKINFTLIYTCILFRLNNMSQLEMRYLTYSEVIELTPARLANAGFRRSKKTNGDGNCFIYAILDLMKYVYTWKSIFKFLHFSYKP